MLQEKYPGVRINIPPLSVVKDELSIAGEKEGVIAVTAYVNQVWKEMEKKCSHISIEVKKSQHRYVIGPKGNSINEILAETGVFVEMPASDNPSETITLRGPQAKLGMALNKVYEKANSVVNVSSELSKLAPQVHNWIEGSWYSKDQSRPSEGPHFFNDDDSIKVDGSLDEAEKAKTELESQANKFIKPWLLLINKITSETDVTINIPDTDSGVTIIRI